MNKILCILFLVSMKLLAQNELGTWNVATVNVKATKSWNFFGEAQLRSLSFYDEFHYYEYKVGATLKINTNFSITSGIGSYNTYSEGGNFELPAQNKEVRTWVQINMKNPLEFLNFEHRYRAEQRFTSNGYRNRFRYRLSATVPVISTKMAQSKLYGLVWNELFFTDNEPFFERNRLFVGGGIEFEKSVTVQVGYIHQFDYKINDEIGRDFMNISIIYNIDLQKIKQKKFTPATAD